MIGTHRNSRVGQERNFVSARPTWQERAQAIIRLIIRVALPVAVILAVVWFWLR